MAKSQNGWPVDVSGARQNRTPIAGVRFPNGFLAGDVYTVFEHLFGRLSREVERMVPGTCWGWFVKIIEGSTTISNHASGTAGDYNATRHPMGVRNTFSRAQQAKIRQILADLDGVIRWGGDYTGRPDDMHFEINKGAAAVRAVAAKIRGELPMDQATFNKLMDGWAKTPAGKAALQALTLDTKIGDEAHKDRTFGDVCRDVAKLRGFLVGDRADTANAAIPPDAPVSRLLT
jgi:hypothetical protein